MIRLRKLAEVCDINPRLPRDHGLEGSTLVTFVPMAAVDEVTGSIATPQVRPFAEVRRGYTAFKENDVLFAKITPCMENGKAALAQGLIGGIGFGSTEFHVLRAGSEVLPEWLRYFVRREQFRRAARRNFTGTAGQQRVPTSFLENSNIPVLALPEQRRVVDLLSRAEGIVRLRREAQAKAQAIIPALFLDMFGDPAINPKGWDEANFGDVVVNNDGQRRPVKAADRASRHGEYPYYGASGIIDYVDEYIFDGINLLIAEDGANLLSRSTPIAFQATGRYWVNNHAHVVGASDRADLTYLEICLNLRDLRDFVTGSAQPKLTQKALSSIPVPLPPMRDQKRFSVQVGQILSLIQQQRYGITKAEDTFNALLTQMFREKVAALSASEEAVA